MTDYSDTPSGNSGSSITLAQLNAMPEAERQEAARDYARGCWCGRGYRHEGWCDGKHHERMRRCQHATIETRDNGTERCVDCGWCFKVPGLLNGEPALIECGRP